MLSYYRTLFFLIISIAPLGAYHFTLKLEVTRGSEIMDGQWEAFADYVDKGFQRMTIEPGVTYTHEADLNSISVALVTGEHVPVSVARRWFVGMEEAVEEANTSFSAYSRSKNTQWTMSFDGEGADGVENAMFSYPEAVDLGGSWIYNRNFGFLYVEPWPWVYNFTLQAWYFSQGTADELWAYYLPFGWVFTSQEVFPWMYFVDDGVWYYVTYVPDSDSDSPYNFSGLILTIIGGGVDILLYAASIFEDQSWYGFYLESGDFFRFEIGDEVGRMGE